MLLRKWSGVGGREDEGDVSGRVRLGEGSVEGSYSRSGIGGETNGRCVSFSKNIRREALHKRVSV